MEKILLITHDDLDGIGCAITTKVLHPDADIKIVSCGYDKIDITVKRYLDQAYDFSQILITDISVNEETAELLEELYKENITNVMLLDHHKTALWLNKYKWATVKVTDNNIRGTQCNTCSTELVYNKFVDKSDTSLKNIKLNYIVNNICSYDTWDWKISDNIVAKQLNDLFKIIGWDEFMNKILNYIESPTNDRLINRRDNYLLSIEKIRIDKYIKDKEKNMFVTEILHNKITYKCGVVYADSYISELANTICCNNPCLAMVIVVTDGNKLSFRTNKVNVDVSEIAKKFNGGGHKQSAGASIDKNLFDNIILTELNKI